MHVARPVVIQPHAHKCIQMGGWSLPCEPTMPDVLGLRTLLFIIDCRDSPSKQLALYFPEPARRTLPRTDATPPSFPNSEVPPSFCRSALCTLKSFEALPVALDIRDGPMIRLALWRSPSVKRHTSGRSGGPR